MRPEAVLAKNIRIAIAKDGRARVVPNFVGMMVSWALVSRALAAGDVGVLKGTWPVDVGLGRGSADLVGMLRGCGRVFCLEVKLPTAHARGANSHEADQARWQASVRRWGGFVAVVRSVPEAIAAVERATRGLDQ